MQNFPVMMQPWFQPVRSTRGFRAGLAALGLIAALFCAGPVSAADAASVIRVQTTRVADLVLLDHGFNAGLREDMVCRITRGGNDIAEVLLVEVRPACSSALILRVTTGQSIRAGDSAGIKILKT